MGFVQVLVARSLGGERKKEGGMGRWGSPRWRGERVLPLGRGRGVTICGIDKVNFPPAAAPSRLGAWGPGLCW